MTVDTPVLQEHYLVPGTVNGAIWRYSPVHPKLFHFHGQYEFLLVKRGWALERVGVQLHRVHAQQLMWHLPGLAHELIEASGDLDLRVVHIEPDLTPPLAALGPLVAGRPLVELQSTDFDALLENCDRTSDSGVGLEDRTQQLVSAAKIAYQATRTDHDHKRATSFADLASCLLLDNPFLERSDICRALDVSGGYLSRQFHAGLGTTLQEQRSRVRVTRFVTLVMRDKRNWLDAALAAGFGSYSQFYRVFTRLVGLGPRAYFCGGGRNRIALTPA